MCAISLAVWLSGCAVVPPPPLQAPAQQDPITYLLKPLPELGGWEVEAALPGELVGGMLCAPALGGRAGEHLEWLSMRADGVPVAATWGRDGCARLPTLHGTLRVRYRAAVTPAHRPAWRAISLSPHADGSTAFFPGESLFLELPSSSQAYGLETRVQFEGLTRALASTLSDDVTGFWASGNEELLRSFVWYGTAEAVSSVGGSHGRWLVVRDARLEGDATESMARDTICLAEQYARWAPEHAPTRGTAMLLLAEWDRAAQGGFARRHGVVLQVGPSVAEKTDEMRLLLAHELFHQVNGESLTFLDASFDETTWFREGVTSYVAAVAAVHAGLLTRQGFVEQLSEHASNYLMNPANYRHDATELDWRRLPYDRGVLLSLALDLFLRDVSDGKRSLRGFWRYLSGHGDWSVAQTNPTLLRALNTYAGVDLTPFFDRYVTGSAAIPVRALLHNVGLAVVSTTREIASFGMRVDYDVDRTELLVSSVTPFGVAHQAGVRVGDVVRSLPTTRFDVVDSPLEFKVLRGAESSFVRLFPERRVVSSVTLQPAPGEGGPLQAILLDDGPAAGCAAAR